MPATVSISNRQRRLAIDSRRWAELMEELLAQLFTNLEQDPPPHLKARFVRQLKERGAISVTFVSDKKIQELNKLWRGKDYATDVLSFPLALENCESQFITPDEAMELGEVIISLERAALQARQFGHSFKRELAFLFVHGCLHVLGFDHLTKAEENEMFARQDLILNSMGIAR